MKRYKNPLGAPNDICYKWALDLGLKRGGDTILYTGCLYQLMSYTESLVRLYERLGRFGRNAARMLTKISERVLAWLIARFIALDDDVYNYSVRSLRGIAEILRRSGVEFGYLYEGDIYSGIYLYELGLEEDFARHAQTVYNIFRSAGVKRVITVDPHTTYVLKEIYPRYIDSYQLEVFHYLEVIRDAVGVAMKKDSFHHERTPPVIHDSCYMVRKLDLYKVVRRGLSNIRYTEPKRTGVNTLCCGGPIEGISPGLALRVAVKRAEELASTGSQRVIVMCPICYVNLKRAFARLRYGVAITDISEEILNATY
ncbi:MAG: (Fe-S)-binding protein [Sulfolobales archaeon]